MSDLAQTGIARRSVALTWSQAEVKPGYSYSVHVSNSTDVAFGTTHKVSGLLSGGSYNCTVTTQTVDGTKTISPAVTPCFTGTFRHNSSNDVQFIIFRSSLLRNLHL